MRLRFLLVLPLLATAAAAPTGRLNLLFILTEDQGAQAGYLGTAGLETPAIDRLARSAVAFPHAFVAYPVCSASKAAIYTGLHGHANGVLNNTLNHHKPASEVTAAERQHPLYRRNRIRDGVATWVERLHEAGYHQGVTHKTHVVPVEKLPYDEFLRQNGRAAVAGFIDRARAAGKPWHLFYNVPNPHRPYPDSDKVAIRVDPAQVEPPPFLPESPVIRQDWAEYLAAIEQGDRFVGEALDALDASGQAGRTVVVFLGDHGPTFAHGKMTLHDLGLRTPLLIRAPGCAPGERRGTLASTVDLAPTLLELLDLPPLEGVHGRSLAPTLRDPEARPPRAFVFAEISARGPLPNDGMQERSVQDRRWKLIYRERTSTAWRQVNADTIQPKPWGNRSYRETVRLRERFPEPYRILAEMHPQALGGKVPVLELYDLEKDPHELRNLAADPEALPQLERLWKALLEWHARTADPATDPPDSPPLP